MFHYVGCILRRKFKTLVTTTESIDFHHTFTCIVAHKPHNNHTKVKTIFKRLKNKLKIGLFFFFGYFSRSDFHACAKERKHNMCGGKTIWNLGFCQFIYHFLSIYQGIMWMLCMVLTEWWKIPKVDYILLHVLHWGKTKRKRLNKLFIVNWYGLRSLYFRLWI